MDNITSITECREYYNIYSKPPKGWMYDGPYYAFKKKLAIKCVKDLQEIGYKAFYVEEKRQETIRLGGPRREPSYNYRVIRTSYRDKEEANKMSRKHKKEIDEITKEHAWVDYVTEEFIEDGRNFYMYLPYNTKAQAMKEMKKQQKRYYEENAYKLKYRIRYFKKVKKYVVYFDAP